MKTLEFKTFLASIDEENEDEVMVTRLKFVIECRKLHQEMQFDEDRRILSEQPRVPTEESDQIKDAISDIQDSFFHATNPSKRVALENTVLRERCQSVLTEAANVANITKEMKKDIFQVSFHET